MFLFNFLSKPLQDDYFIDEELQKFREASERIKRDQQVQNSTSNAGFLRDLFDAVADIFASDKFEYQNVTLSDLVEGTVEQKDETKLTHDLINAQLKALYPLLWKQIRSHAFNSDYDKSSWKIMDKLIPLQLDNLIEYLNIVFISESANNKICKKPLKEINLENGMMEDPIMIYCFMQVVSVIETIRLEVMNLLFSEDFPDRLLKPKLLYRNLLLPSFAIGNYLTKRVPYHISESFDLGTGYYFTLPIRPRNKKPKNFARERRIENMSYYLCLIVLVDMIKGIGHLDDAQMTENLLDFYNKKNFEVANN